MTAEYISDESQLIDQMTTPNSAVRAAVADLQGDVMILGVGGKMGPTLAELLVRAGAPKVIGVSRFTDAAQRSYLEGVGVTTIQADLLNEEDLSGLPDVSNIMLLAGFKFGSTGNESMTWAMNTAVPGLVMKRFPQSRVIYVSSGNVYSYTDTSGSGSPETGELGPIGEYAQSRLGGERIAEYYAALQETPLTIVRLFYATELRYGIIHDIVHKVSSESPIELAMGHVNQIWQGDANRYLACMFPLCNVPAFTVNLTGPEVLSIRSVAERAGEVIGKKPIFHGLESPTSLLGDTRLLYNRFDPPDTSIDQIISWAAHWVSIDGRSLGKPTKYESRSGSF